MLSIWLQSIKLATAIWDGVRHDQSFRALFFLMLSLMIGATIFYRAVEGWSVVDALYFTVMTMSTIGYGDLVPTTTLSKIFTIVFSLLSIGVYVAVVSKIVEITLARKKALGEKRHNRRVAAKQKKEDNKQAP